LPAAVADLHFVGISHLYELPRTSRRYPDSSSCVRPVAGCGVETDSTMDNVSNETDEEYYLLQNLDEETLTRVYYSPPRFYIETLFATVAIASNIFILVALAVADCGGRRDQSMLKKLTPVHTSRSYSQLFVNLAVANCLSCILSWLSNNTLLLFQDQLLPLLITNQCLFFVFLVSSIFVSTSFVIVSTLTMLGFSVVQYSAICRRPVLARHPGDLNYRRSRVPVYIAVIWTLSLIAGVSPFAAHASGNAPTVGLRILDAYVAS
jgi:hypothetical protein